jgi:hypothetical protein
LWVRISRKRGLLDTTLCDKVCQCLATGRWFSLGTLASSTNKTDRHDITEILLNVLLNTILPFTVGCIMYPNPLIFLEVHKVVCRRFQYAKTKTLKEKYKVKNLDLWCYVTQWLDSFFDPHPPKKNQKQKQNSCIQNNWHGDGLMTLWLPQRQIGDIGYSWENMLLQVAFSLIRSEVCYKHMTCLYVPSLVRIIHTWLVPHNKWVSHFIEDGLCASNSRAAMEDN